MPMFAFSGRIEIPAGATLAGYSESIDVPTVEPGALEIHGFGSEANGGWQIVAIDALYAGVLARKPQPNVAHCVIAASHTHFAPQLDPDIPEVGRFSNSTAQMLDSIMRDAPRRIVAPDRCRLLVAEADVPVYRRFDYPDTALNILLSRHAGHYPNEAYPIDKRIYIFAFSQCGRPAFDIIYHACHPVTRKGRSASPDYIGALRAGVNALTGSSHCLFLQGCAGDVRPNLSQKRLAVLPRSRLNWRFKPPRRSIADEQLVDKKYREAVDGAEQVADFAISESEFQFRQHDIAIRGLGKVPTRQLDIGDRFSFAFLPFEVSHRYHMELLEADRQPRRFIVSCADDVRGYLPHRDQHRHSGYEVDGSRAMMGLRERICMNSEELWPSK